MNPVVTIALLTLREAVRRRLVAACAVITIGLVALSTWGFDRLSHNASITSGEVGVAIPQALILFMFMFSFVVALSASAMASPAISAEAESGVLLSILARPVRRSEVLLGKWLGLATVILAYSAVVSGLEVGVVDWVGGFVPPNPVLVALYLFAEGAILLTLTLLLSTRLSAIATGVVGDRAVRGCMAGRRRRIARHRVQDLLAHDHWRRHALHPSDRRTLAWRDLLPGAPVLCTAAPHEFAQQRQSVLRPGAANMDVLGLGRCLVSRGARGRDRQL